MLARRSLSRSEQGCTWQGKGLCSGSPLSLFPESGFALPGSAPRGWGGHLCARRRVCKLAGGRRAPSTAGGDPTRRLSRSPPSGMVPGVSGPLLLLQRNLSTTSDPGAGLQSHLGLGMGSPPRASPGTSAGRAAPSRPPGVGPRWASREPGRAPGGCRWRPLHSAACTCLAFQILKMFPATGKCPNRL